mgnify:CR=1 FL=1
MLAVVEIEKKGLTVKEFQELTKFSRAHVYRMLNKGEIAGQYRLGQSWRIDYEQYEANRQIK